jgi:hypothetical protein
VFFARELIRLFYVVFYLLADGHQFDFGPGIN